MITESFVRKLAEEKTEGTSLFVLEVKIRKGNRILVTIDGDQGVTIDDCVQISRYVEHKLDRETEDFELQVSSGGADQPLVLPRQYPKHTGRTIMVKMKDGNEKTGVLRIVTESEIEIEKIPEKGKKKNSKPEEPLQEVLPFALIKESLIVITF